MGGIIKESFRRFLVGFSSHYGRGTDDKAELRDLVDSLEHFMNLTFYFVALYSDSQLIVNQLLGHGAYIGKCLRIMKRCKL